MAFRAVLFDMDGTLIDIFDLWRSLLGAYLAPFDASLSEEQFRTAMTLSYNNLACFLKDTCRLDKTPQEIMHEIDLLSLTEYAPLATLKKGVTPFIKKLYKQGLQMYLVTTNLSEIAADVLRHFSLKKYFCDIYGARELSFPKQDFRCFLDIAERIGVSPEECAVFEDSPHAAKSAKEAGMTVFGVLGEQTEEEQRLLHAIADKIVESNYERMDLQCKKSE